MIECQVDFAMDCIKKMRQNKLTAIEPKLSAQDSFVAKLRDDLKDTVWAGGCRSWYMNDAGEVSTIIQNTNFILTSLTDMACCYFRFTVSGQVIKEPIRENEAFVSQDS